MKSFLHSVAARISKSRVMRAIANRVLFPAMVPRLLDEFQVDVASSTGIAESIAWKTHSYIVLASELRLGGLDCNGPRLRCDRESRSAIIDALTPDVRRADGDVLEFGVHEGESLRALATRFPDRAVWGFDSFEGLPEDWWNKGAGHFKTEVPTFPNPNIKLVKGWFNESLPSFVRDWNGKASLLHIDCDLYSSTRTVFEVLGSRLEAGTVVLFDEYYNYEGFSEHEWLAWHQFLRHYGKRADCIAFDSRRAAFRLA